VPHPNPKPELIERFYRSLVDADRDGVTSFCEAWLDEDVVLSLPASLPYGGQVAGSRRLTRMFTAMCDGPAPVGPRNLAVVRVLGEDGADGTVAAVLSFDFRTASGELVPTGAVELWRFAAGRIVAIEAYYGDTAAVISR